MKNFYYVLSFNTTNPTVKAMLSRQTIFATCDTMIDLKVRSRPYMSFTEATIAGHKDFQQKQVAIFNDKKDYTYRHICVINPEFIMTESNVSHEQIVERFGASAFSSWDDNCCSVLFFLTDDGVNFEEGEAPEISPDMWMLKYEIMFFDDGLELPGNGDFVFAPTNANCELSTIH
jgi:hypothetical protein